MSLGPMLFGINTQYSAQPGVLEVYLNPSGYSISDYDGYTPYFSAVGLYFYNTGTLTRLQQTTYYNYSPGWLTGGNADEVDVKITKSSGTITLTGMTDNTWYNLGTNRSVYADRSVIGTATYSGTIYLCSTGNPSDILASTSLSFTLENGTL